MQLGNKIRDLRRRCGMTVQQLAEASRLSKGFISQVENGHTLPSLTTLHDLANALGTSAAYFVTEEERVPHVTRAGDRQRLRVGGNTSRVEALSAQRPRNLDLVLAELPPGLSANGKMHLHHGEECIFILEGRVLLVHADQRLELEAGDSCHFDGHVPHSVENRGTTTARVLIAMTPAAFEPLVRVRDGVPAAGTAGPRLAPAGA
jgi:transcriptional regulator with XRE-family HTH domain